MFTQVSPQFKAPEAPNTTLNARRAKQKRQNLLNQRLPSINIWLRGMAHWSEGSQRGLRSCWCGHYHSFSSSLNKAPLQCHQRPGLLKKRRLMIYLETFFVPHLYTSLYVKDRCFFIENKIINLLYWDRVALQMSFTFIGFGKTVLNRRQLSAHFLKMSERLSNVTRMKMQVWVLSCCTHPPGRDRPLIWPGLNIDDRQ